MWVFPSRIVDPGGAQCVRRTFLSCSEVGGAGVPVGDVSGIRIGGSCYMPSVKIRHF